MTEITVGLENLEISFRRVIPLVDDIDSALGTMPAAPDGGVASELIGFTMAAAAEAGGVTADSFRALIAVARDVLVSFADNDAEAAAELREIEKQIEEVT